MERTSNFCLARKSTWPLISSDIFTQWGWLIHSARNIPGQFKDGEREPIYHFLRTFRAGRTYFLSAPFIAAESQYHEESRLTYGPFESTLLEQGFQVEHELDACNSPLTRNTFMSPQIFTMSTATRNYAQTSNYLIPGQPLLETFMPLSYSNQDHTFMGDYIIPVLKHQTWLLLRL